MAERVRSESRMQQAMQLVQQAAGRHVKKRAELLSSIAKDMHRNAPRGGRNKNAFGEQRSAEGEAPAMEYGALFANIDQGVETSRLEATVIVNYRVLEDGTRRGLRPRPLGRKASSELKKRVK